MSENYLEKLQDENMWISKDMRNNIPAVINDKYDKIKECVMAGESAEAYLAILLVKDLYETIMKIPVVMGLTFVNSNFDIKKDYISVKAAELQEKKYDLIENILDSMLSNPLSMGSWSNLINQLINVKDDFHIPEKIELILYKTKTMLNMKISNGKDGKYENIVNWRNAAIGHGAISCDANIYWEQLNDLISIINKYFSSMNNIPSLNDLYENVFFEESEAGVVLSVDNEKYDASEFVKLLNANWFYFESYYSRKRELTISDYLESIQSYNDEKFEEFIECFENLKERYNRINRKRKKGKILATGERIAQLKCLKSIMNYQKPLFIINKLNEVMNNCNNGVIMLKMERGTGKTTMTHHLDGQYLANVLQEDLKAIVRVYHISDMNIVANKNTTPNDDFYKGMPTLFDEHPIEKNISRYIEQDKAVHPDYIETHKQNLLSVDSADYNSNMKLRRETIVELLSLYRDIYTDIDGELDEPELNDCYDENRLVLIIDGIDELNAETSKILDSIPTRTEFEENKFAKNIFIILTSRNEAEEGLEESSIQAIKKATEIASEIIEIENNSDEFSQLLVDYVKQINPSLEENMIEEIIKKSQNKFLYIRPYMILGDELFKDGNFGAKNVASKYIDYVLKQYIGISLHNLYLIMTSIALLDELSISEIGLLVMKDGVTFDLIGCINDLSPLLTTIRKGGATKYKFANSEYKEYVLEKFDSSLKEVVNLLQSQVDSIKDKKELEAIEIAMGQLSKVAESYDRINDGDEYTKEQECGYKQLAHTMMLTVLDYLEKMLNNNLDIYNEKIFIDLLNYISAFGRANEAIKNKAKELEEKIVNYCANSKQVTNWFEKIFVNGVDYGERKIVIEGFGVNTELVEYIIKLSENKKYQDWFSIHLHIENLKLLLEYCTDKILKKEIENKLRELLLKDFNCPQYYQKTYDELKKKYLESEINE